MMMMSDAAAVLENDVRLGYPLFFSYCSTSPPASHHRTKQPKLVHFFQWRVGERERK